MSLTEVWTRNSFEVEAVQVTEENLDEVSIWCHGVISQTKTENPKRYILVDVFQHDRVKVAKAFVGDWVVMKNDEFKHYRDKAFRSSFARQMTRAQIYDQIMAQVDAACRVYREEFDSEDEKFGINLPASIATQKIMDLFGGE